MRRLFLVVITFQVHPQISPPWTETVTRLAWATTPEEAQQKVQEIITGKYKVHHTGVTYISFDVSEPIE